MKLRILSIFLLSLALFSCSSSEPKAPEESQSGDSDGDGLSDELEGAPTRDSDGDGVPDFKDEDSDDDGLPDTLEGSEDHDKDGAANFVDEDSDGDGVLDAHEGDQDSDGDGVPDRLDLDSDGDGLFDSEEAPGGRLEDFDQDGVPDFRDDDSDGDGIGDLYEGGDTDGDEIPDRHDLDADDDGILDAEERGEGDTPRDSDRDGIADFRERDSDGDGLGDELERFRIGSDPSAFDSDGDGHSDLVELVAESDPLDSGSSPDLRTKRYLVFPADAPPYPAATPLQVRAAVQSLDLYFAIDASTSMEEEYAALRDEESGLPAVIAALECAPLAPLTPCRTQTDCPVGAICGPEKWCVEDPGVSGCVPDIQTGLGVFGNLDTYQNLLSIQPDPLVTARAIPLEGEPARPSGPDGPLVGPWAEAPFQVPVCVADPAACQGEDHHCSSSGLGCPGFREHARRLYIQISDADNQCADPDDEARGTLGARYFPETFYGMGRCQDYDPSVAGKALRALGIKFIGLHGHGRCKFSDPSCDDFPQRRYNSWVQREAQGRPLVEDYTPRSAMEAIARASGSMDASGGVFVSEALDAQVVKELLHATKDIVARAPMRVELELHDLVEGPEDDVDATAFIQSIALDRASPKCDSEARLVDGDGDGIPDSLSGLTPGDLACWELGLSSTLPFKRSRDRLRVYRARAVVYGDGSPLAERELVFIIAPDPATPIAHRRVRNVYDDSGQRRYQIELKGDHREGAEIWWDAQGEVVKRCRHLDGEEVSCQELPSLKKSLKGQQLPIQCPLGTQAVTESTPAGRVVEAWCQKPDGREHGPRISWHINGQKASAGEVEDGAKAGVWRWWDEAGRPYRECTYSAPGASPTCKGVGEGM